MLPLESKGEYEPLLFTNLGFLPFMVYKCRLCRYIKVAEDESHKITRKSIVPLLSFDNAVRKLQSVCFAKEGVINSSRRSKALLYNPRFTVS